MSSPLHSTLPPLHIKDAGVASGAFHMYADAQTLDILQQQPVDKLVVRTFQWDKPTISFGYLLDTEKVKKWAESIAQGPWSVDLVKRPTGGGAVLHLASDLSFSLAWRRETRIFSDSPRTCYEQIHAKLIESLKTSLQKTNPTPLLFTLHSPSSDICSPPQRGGGRGGVSSSPASVPVCFNEPVCNDVMEGDKKIVGGALRITKSAILYQGTIQLPHIPMSDLKDAVRRAFA